MGISNLSKQNHSITMGRKIRGFRHSVHRSKPVIQHSMLILIWLVLLTGISAGSVSGLVSRSDTDPSNVALVTSKKLLSIGADDGWILESTETSNKGGTMSPTSTTLWLGDDAQDRQYRVILSFDTSTIPANAVIKSVFLKIRRQSLSGTDPFKTHGNLTVDIRKGMFSNNRTLQLGDFAVAPSKASAMNFSKTLVSGWYTATLGSANFGYINKAGLRECLKT